MHDQDVTGRTEVMTANSSKGAMNMFQPIHVENEWNPPEGIQVLDETYKEEIESLLMGHKVTKVSEDHLMLDNGTVVKVVGNDGGCACSAGCYPLSVLNDVDNIITKVEFDYHPTGDFDPWDGPNAARVCDPEQEEYTGHYRIFVYAEDQRINLMQFDGSDGNGYYGTGFNLFVRPVKLESNNG